MIILGIDPGYAILGWGVIEKTGNHFRAIDYGAVTTDKDMEMPDRLEALYNGLREIIEEYRPEEASIEKLFSILTRPQPSTLDRRGAWPFWHASKAV